MFLKTTSLPRFVFSSSQAFACSSCKLFFNVLIYIFKHLRDADKSVFISITSNLAAADITDFFSRPYLDNANLIYSLKGENSNIGNVRETFFMNQMRLKNQVYSSKKADFEINELIFEIGGKNKNQRQIEHDGKSFIVKDDIEFGYLNVIPLWAFGMNY